MRTRVAYVKISITLSARHVAAVRELAKEQCDGNLSEAFRRLIESHDVTKSAAALPPLAKLT